MCMFVCVRRAPSMSHWQQRQPAKALALLRQMLPKWCYAASPHITGDVLCLLYLSSIDISALSSFFFFLYILAASAAITSRSFYTQFAIYRPGDTCGPHIFTFSQFHVRVSSMNYFGKWAKTQIPKLMSCYTTTIYWPLFVAIVVVRLCFDPPGYFGHSYGYNQLGQSNGVYTQLLTIAGTPRSTNRCTTVWSIEEWKRARK